MFRFNDPTRVFYGITWCVTKPRHLLSASLCATSTSREWHRSLLPIIYIRYIHRDLTVTFFQDRQFDVQRQKKMAGWPTILRWVFALSKLRTDEIRINNRRQKKLRPNLFPGSKGIFEIWDTFNDSSVISLHASEPWHFRLAFEK